MVRFILRFFAGLFGSVSAASAIALEVDQEWGAAVMGGLLAFFALRYAFSARRRASPRRSRSRTGRTSSADFDFLQTAVPSRRGRKPPAPLVDNAWPPKGDFACDVVGESNYQEALIAAVGAPPAKWQEVLVTAELVCEPNNQYDPKAVAVRVNGRRVGYLSLNGARSFHGRLNRRKIAGQTTRCGAMIRGGGIAHDGTQRMLGILLDIQPFS